jgi:putative intracellular protease/amidase
LVEGRTITSHPSVRAELTAAGAELNDRPVVRDGVLLTSQGPGTAMEFALAVAAALVGDSTAQEVKTAMCVN